MEVFALSKRLLDYASGFAAYMQSGTNLSERTRQLYAYELTLFARNVENPLLTELSPQTLLQWNQMLYDAGAAVNTISSKHSAVKKFLDYLEEFPEDKETGEHAGRLLRSLKRLHTPRDREPPRKPFSLDEGQVSKMLQAAGARLGRGPRDRAMVHLLWAAGIRRAELRDLLLDDLDMSERLATVTGKGAKTRTIVYDADCKEDLVKWLELRLYWRVPTDEQHVFVSVQGGPLALNYIGEMVREIAKEAGLRKEVWTHLFRHTRVTALLNKGMALQEVASFVGHTNVQTTMGYYHQDTGRLKDSYDRAMKPKRTKGAPAHTTEEPTPDDDPE
jgi:integrase/recombinase XerC